MTIRKKNHSWLKRAAAAGVLALTASSVTSAAFADELRNNVGGSGATITVAPGGSVSVGYALSPTSTPTGDPAGCDASGGGDKTTITVSSTNGYGTGNGSNALKIGNAASDATKTVTNCRRTVKFTFTAGSGLTGSYAIHAVATDGVTGSLYANLGDFTLKVVQGVAATNLVLAPASQSITYGTTDQTWTATLTTGASTPVPGKTIQFNVGGAAYSATTNASGVATLVAPIGTTYDADATAYTVDASFAGDTSYAASSDSGNLTVTKASQAAFSITGPTSGSFGQVKTITTSGGSGTGTTTYAASGACSLTAPGASTLLITSGSGTCSITASNPGDRNYLNTSDSSSFAVGAASQSALTITGPSSATFGAPDATIVTSGGSGTGAVTVDAGASTGCSIESGKLHVTDASGTCALTATKAADANYAATSTASSFPVSLIRATQTVSITGPTRGTYGQSYDIAYTKGDGTGAVTFSAGSSTACDVVDGKVRITSGTGSCALVATQASDSNYDQATSASFSVTPDKATATISLSDVTETYDGGAHPVAASVSPDVPGLAVTYGRTATAPTHAGSYTVVASLTNDDYAAIQVQKTLTISPKTLTGAITADGKEYDGTTAAVVHPVALDGVVTGDDVALTASNGVFGVAGAGARTVTATIALAGDDIADYELASTTATASATIAKRVLVGSITAADKTYDRNTTATASPAEPALDRVMGTDDVTLVVGTATFDSADAGPRTVTAAISLGGADRANYELRYPTATALASISPLTVGASITAANKPYDGSESASVTPHLTGVLTGDTVTADPLNAHFDSKDVGTSKTVTAGLQLDNTNYALPTGPFTATASITAKGLTGSFTAASKTYDGTRAATVSNPTLTGVVPNEDVTLTVTGAQFADKNAGTGKVVTAGSSSLGGADKANYVLDGVNTTTASITALDVSGSFTAQNKTYDGNASAMTSAPTVVGKLDGDDVSLSLGGATFDNANVGTGKTVTASSPALTGIGAGNYHLVAVSTATADITVAQVNVTAKSYPVIKGAPVPTVGYDASGFVTGEGFSTAPTCGTTYTTASPAGTYPTSCSGGAAGSNYTVQYVSGIVTVGYAYSQLLQPINVDRSSSFKAGSTIPVKFQLLDANNVVQDVPGLTFTLRWTKLDPTPDFSVNEAIITSSGDSGSTFRYDATGKLYIFNLSTKTAAMGEGTWRLDVFKGTSVVVSGYVNVKK